MRRTASLRARALDVVKSWIPVSCGGPDVMANRRLDFIDGLLYTMPQSYRLTSSNTLSQMVKRAMNTTAG
jgi:hypothetical protein